MKSGEALQRRGARARHGALLLALALAVPRNEARAEATNGSSDVADEAELHFQLGAEAYRKGDYATALAHFLASNGLVANHRVQFNIARVYQQLRRYPEAYRYFSETLEAMRDPDERRAVASELDKLSPEVARIRVETSPPEAEIYVDRIDLGQRGKSPRTLGLLEGSYRILARLPGHEPADSGPIMVARGGLEVVRLNLKPIVGHVRVVSPAGAVVRVERQDAEPLGTAPLDFDLRPGPHRVYLSKPGFVDEEVLVVVEPRETAVVTKALAPRTGTIVVSADMVDALVELDGKPAGFAPTVLVVPVGPHRVRVSFAGYRSEEKNLDVQEDAKLGEHFQLLRVEEVNAASRFTESAEDASTSVTIISREEIQAMAYPTLTEALRSVRGMYLTDTRDYPSAGFLTRSGDYNSRILLLVDGAIANDNYNWTAYMDFDGRVDLDDIERIEILRGPGSVLYGTGAELGVINLVTRREKERTHGEVGAGTVQYGVTRGRAALFWRPTEHAGARVTAAAAHGLGRDFYFSEFAEDPQTLGTIRGLDGFDALHTNGSVWYKDLSLQWQLHARDKTIPTGQSGAALGQPTRYSDARGFLEVKFEPKLSSAVRSSTTAQLNRYAYHDLIFRTGGTERTVFVGDWLHLEQRLSYTWGSGARLTAGGVYERHFRVDLDKVQAAEPRKESRPFDLGAAYATLDLAPTRAVKLSLGGRVDAYSDRNASISPRLAAVFRPQPDDIVKVLAGRAFRAPGTFELQYQSGLSEGAPRLKPEECYSTGVEYTHRFSTTITGLLESFANATTNYITLRGEGDGARYVNLDATLANVGAGAELRREWRQGWMLAVHGTVQSAWYEGGASTRPVTNVPGTIGSIRGAIPLLGRGLTMTHRLTYNGPRWDRFENESEPPQERTGAALLWDAVLGGESDNGDWRYAVGAYNLFDWRWTVPTSAEFGVLRSIPQNGRTFLASLSASF